MPDQGGVAAPESNGSPAHDPTAGEGEPMGRKEFERKLKPLHVELVKLQLWAQHTGLRAVVIFEGRDAAGKGGAIKAITERVSPRVFRIIALPSPTDREKTQMYVQRYMAHIPAAGEIVLFDRSWYNRAGVEHVMGFCTDERVPGVPRAHAARRTLDRRAGDHPDQILVRGEPGTADRAVSGAPRRWA